MSSYIEALAVSEQLYGRNVKEKKNDKSGQIYYAINYPELREKNVNTNVSFGPRSFTMSTRSYEGSKLKHIVESKLAEFKHWVHVVDRTDEVTLRTGRSHVIPTFVVNIRLAHEEDVVPCWNRIFELLFQEDYLEMSVRLLEEAVEKLKKEGKTW